MVVMPANIFLSLLLQGRVVAVHEGGYSEQYVPFCGLAVIEQLAGVRTKVMHCPCESYTIVVVEAAAAAAADAVAPADHALAC
jgi:acetoin utilization deacetylase AcuC-like enzyme